MSFIPDSILRKAIDVIYMKYDKDRSNTLEANQLTGCFNQLLGMVNVPTAANSFVMKMLLKKIDRDHDGRISKPQFMSLFKMFESMGFMGGQTKQQPQQQGGWGGQQQQGGWGGQQQQGQHQQGGWGNQPVNQPNNFENQGGYGGQQGVYGGQQGGYGGQQGNFSNQGPGSGFGY